MKQKHKIKKERTLTKEAHTTLIKKKLCKTRANTHAFDANQRTAAKKNERH